MRLARDANRLTTPAGKVSLAIFFARWKRETLWSNPLVRFHSTEFLWPAYVASILRPV